jgi:hypothetical protein
MRYIKWFPPISLTMFAISILMAWVERRPPHPSVVIGMPMAALWAFAVTLERK